jgi:hypothetical protein
MSPTQVTAPEFFSPRSVIEYRGHWYRVSSSSKSPAQSILKPIGLREISQCISKGYAVGIDARVAVEGGGLGTIDATHIDF